MNYREITPEDRLKPFVKCFYIFQSGSDAEFEDVVFPSGFTEIIFNLGQGVWASYDGKNYRITPQIELWGQVTKPTQIKSKGKHLMLGVRFFPHSAGYFLKEDIAQFNNIVSDLSDVLGPAVKTLHSRLLETNDLIRRIELIELFLLKRLSTDNKINRRIEEIGELLHDINKNYSENNISIVASQHGITPRYLHKLVYQHTGLSPKSLNRINRFQLSLKLIAQNEESLTSIAYECGYFDQSHFIRDFKSFTGVTPSDYLENKFPFNQVFLQ
ncbi:MAG TPA: AraC family transcriptional regulator [Chitinophagaceae bacterium]|nr:AraC family transcriptional regulator [Chitinophagaceae bacterium]